VTTIDFPAATQSGYLRVQLETSMSHSFLWNICYPVFTSLDLATRIFFQSKVVRFASNTQSEGQNHCTPLTGRPSYFLTQRVLFSIIYDSQNGGGSILTCLHMGQTPSIENLNTNLISLTWSWLMSSGSSVGIATGYGLDDRQIRVRVPVGSRILNTSYRSDKLWGPSRLLPTGYRRLFHWGLSGRGAKLTTHLQLVPGLRKPGTIHPLPPMSS
jgi:hypothetical protein